LQFQNQNKNKVKLVLSFVIWGLIGEREVVVLYDNLGLDM
jgi:hypothetical protein